MQLSNPSFDFANLSEQKCLDILTEYAISLTVEEARQVQAMLRREPTWAECTLWGIQGSEHCSYKSSRLDLKTLTTTGPNVISGAKEDAGIIALTENPTWALAISHESHNHPSQVVPFEGAATCIGGNVRDVCCMGAKVIANADSLRFGSDQSSHTRWLFNDVVDGIASYGNALGVPNIAGDVQFDSGFQDNCLVTALTLGVVKANNIIHSYVPDDAEGFDLILVGKPTDNSGFGGASFASATLDADKHEQNKGAVQEPNAFLGRVLLQANYALFDKLAEQNLLARVGFKDLGAGGIACASLEMVEANGFGAKVWLDEVHVSMEGLNPAVILCSETQERYMWAVPPELTPIILSHYNDIFALPEISAGAGAVVVGQVTADGIYQASCKGKVLVDAKASDITKGIVYDRPAAARTRQLTEPALTDIDLHAALLSVLADVNVTDNDLVSERYDKQVQGRTIIERHQADAGVIAPFNSQDQPPHIRQIGVALALAANPRLGQIDAYWCAVNAMLQAIQSVIAVGASPQAISDCLCFGNPEDPAVMSDFKQAISGIKDTCEQLMLYEHNTHGLPVIAGNVSLYNDSQGKPVPASPMIGCVGKLQDVDQVLTPKLVASGNLLVLVGSRHCECGGSIFYHQQGYLGERIPKPDLATCNKYHHALLTAMGLGLVKSAKAINLGGVASALAKMAINSDYGLDVALPTAFKPWQILFSETPGLVLEVASKDIDAFSQCMEDMDVDAEVIGRVTTEPELKINKTCWHKDELQLAHKGKLRRILG